MGRLLAGLLLLSGSPRGCSQSGPSAKFLLMKEGRQFHLIPIQRTAPATPVPHNCLKHRSPSAGDSFSVADTACGTATVTLLGCFTDALYQAKQGRDLPYNLPGCFKGDELPWCKSAPSPPPCVPKELDNAYCAKACADWAPRIPGADPDDLFMSTQAGFACFCGTIAEGEKATVAHSKLP